MTKASRLIDIRVCCKL